MAALGVNSQVFLEGLRTQNKNIELDQTQQELDIKKKQGTGI
jgi:hypothetical protein